MSTNSQAFRPGAAGKPSAGSRKVRVTPTSPSSEHIGKVCSTCGTGILQSDTIVICPECSLPYHHDCWNEIGGCGTYGCSAAPVAALKEAVAEDIFTPGWTAEKKCPECSSSILANALVCKVCRVTFPTERPMTKAEWQDREYDEKEIARVKVAVAIQFLCSTIGCIAFIMLPLNLVAAFTDSWAFNVKRLPPSLKILFYAALAITVLWGIIAVALILYSMVAK